MSSNSHLTGAVATVAQGIFSESSTQLHKLGEVIFANDGRSYRYCKAGGTALVPGKLQQAPAEDTTNFQNLTVTAPSAGDSTITTTSTVTLTANQLAGGFLTITSATTNAGQTFKIKSHPAATAAAVTFTLDDTVTYAPTGTVTIDAHPNPYNGVIVNPTTLSSAPIGVAVYKTTAAYFGWLQVRGPVGVLADGANAVGAAVVASNGVAGAVEDAAGPGAQGPQVGTCITGAADTEYGLVNVSLQ